MLSQRVLARTLGVDAKSVRVEGIELVDDVVEIRCRPRIQHRWRCPHCGEVIRRRGLREATIQAIEEWERRRNLEPKPLPPAADLDQPQ